MFPLRICVKFQARFRAVLGSGIADAENAKRQRRPLDSRKTLENGLSTTTPDYIARNEHSI
jgi:hypothetical protein